MKYKWMSALYAFLTIAVVAGVLSLRVGIVPFVMPEVQSVILAALLLLFYLNGGYRQSALLVFDAVTTDADNRNTDRYRSGANLLARISRQLYLWCGIIFIYSLVLLFANIHEPRFIGPAVACGLTALWTILMVRTILIIPMQLSLYHKLSLIDNTVSADDSRSAVKAFVAGRIAAVALLIVLPSALLLRFTDYRIDQFFDPGLLVLLLGTMVFPSWMGVGFMNFFRMTATAASAEGNRYRSKVLHSFGILAVEAGAAALITKIIFMLMLMDNLKKIPYEFSAALAPLFFGMLIAGAVFFPLAGYIPGSPDKNTREVTS